jgi:hypothetical protein
LDNFWRELLTLVLTPAAVVVAVTFVARSWLQHGFAKDLETFKNQLRLQAIEFQTCFSVLHQKRAEVLGQLYARLVSATNRLASVVSTTQMPDGTPLSKKWDDVTQMCVDSVDYFLKHRIYLDEDVCREVDEVVRIMHSATGNFSEAHRNRLPIADAVELWRKASDLMGQKMPPLKNKLEQRFRDLLEGK